MGLTASRVVAVIPAYQAEQTIEPLVRALRRQGLRVFVVDDASTDQTEALAQEAGAKVLRREKNGGKGVALREGFSLALREPCDWVLTMDSDGQHLPEDVPRFLEAADGRVLDLVIGNRMGNPQGMPLARRLTNWVMSAFLSWLCGQRVPDTQCGMRLIHRRVLEAIPLASNRFEIESELIVKSAWARFRIASAPIASIYRSPLSFVRPLQDTLRFLRFLLILRR